MEENNMRKVNGKYVHPSSELITVELLDWSKLNNDINEYLHARIPERKDEEFYFDEEFSGLIEIDKSICLIATKESITREIEIFDYMQGIIGFSMGIYVKDKDPNIINTTPEFHFSVIAATEFQKIRTGKKMNLPDFMGERYKYNPRISNNEIQLINFLTKECNYKPFEKLKK